MKSFRKTAIKILANVKIFVGRICGEDVSQSAVLREFLERDDLSDATLIWAMIALGIEAVLLLGLLIGLGIIAYSVIF